MIVDSQFLRKEILEMGELVQRVLSISYNNNETLEAVLALEEQINRKHIHIDDEIFKYIALQKPAATDLRLALAAMKINAELERIGDQSMIIKTLFPTYPKKCFPTRQYSKSCLRHVQSIAGKLCPRQSGNGHGYSPPRWAS